MSHEETMHEALDALAFTIEPVPPPADVKVRMLSRIKAREFYFDGADDAQWEPLGGTRLERRALFVRPEDRRATRAFRAQPGGKAADLASADWSALGLGFAVLLPASPAGDALAIGFDGATGDRAAAAAEVVDARAVREDAHWQEIVPGVEELVLIERTADGARVALVRMAAGAAVGSHAHDGTEELLLLEGDCLCAERVLEPGDFHRAGNGTVHRLTSTQHGCRMLCITRAAA